MAMRATAPPTPRLPESAGQAAALAAIRADPRVELVEQDSIVEPMQQGFEAWPWGETLGDLAMGRRVCVCVCGWWWGGGGLSSA